MQKGGSLDLHAFTLQGLAVLDDGQNGAFEQRLHVGREDDLVSVKAVEIHELQVLGAGHGLAAVDAVGPELFLDLIEQCLDFLLVLLGEAGMDVEDVAVLLVGVSSTESDYHALEGRNRNVVPWDVHRLSRTDLDGPGTWRSRTKERLAGFPEGDAVPPLQHAGRRHCAVVGAVVELAVQADLGLLVAL